MFTKFLTILGTIAGTVLAVAASAFSVEHLGQSGKVVLHPFGTEDKRYVEISLSGIEELTPEGASKGWKTPNLASQSFTWSDPTTIVDNTDMATMVMLTSVMNVGGNPFSGNQVFFAFTTLISENEISIPYGNETVNLPQAALKWTIDLGPWPWKNNNQDGVLAFSIKFKSHKYGEARVDNNVVKLPEGVYMDLEKFAIIDGEETPIDYMIKETSGQSEITFIFPHYTTSVNYDPVVGIDQEQESSSVDRYLSAFLLFGLNVAYLYSL